MPVDYRLYAKKEDGYTKNQHFQEMIRLASHRGFKPRGVLTELQANRNVSLEPHKYLRVDKLDYENNKDGINAHLKGYGFIKVFKITAPNGRIGYFATPDQNKSSKDIREAYALRWEIEEYHRRLKQATGIECCQARKSRIQRNHIFCSILAFTALEQRRLETGTSWYESKGDPPQTVGTYPDDQCYQFVYFTERSGRTQVTKHEGDLSWDTYNDGSPQSEKNKYTC